jgi:hypothetical protein
VRCKSRQTLTNGSLVRRIALAGVVTLTALLGSVLPASAATSPEPGTATANGGFFSLLGSTVSCGSPTTCLAVGSNLNNKSGSITPSAEAWNGKAWRSVAVPRPKGAELTIVASVSCKSATSCLVVGSYDTPGENGSELPYALSWNGAALRPTAALPAPKGGGLVSFNGVSCVSVKSCVAIGSQVGGGLPLVVETWNGAKWALRTARGLAGSAFTDVSAVSCRSVTSCVIAGESYSTTGTPSMLLARWNGKGFTAMKAAAPAGGKNILLNAVSCTSATSCVAAGLSANSAGTAGFGFTELWNGKSWTPDKVAVPRGDSISYLFGVSCVTSRNCIAVGGVGTAKSGRGSALAYNGKTWSALKVPAPAKGKSSSFSGVSCPKAADCVAIGQTGASGGTSPTPLSGLWNGSSWRLVAA